MVVVSSAHRVNTTRIYSLFLGLSLIVLGCHPSPDSSVVVYCAQDQVFAEPIFTEFTRKTGIRVLPIFDTEATKTVGLVHRLIAEVTHPQCDVFWGNEELRTRQLEARGVFGTNRIAGIQSKGWKAFGQRTRCLIYFAPTNTSGALPPLPNTLEDLANPRWRGRIAVANPRFGTTAAHWISLRQIWGKHRWQQWCTRLLENRPFIEEGNSHVVRRVARGEAWIGLTDSDDFMAGLREGLPIAKQPLQEGVLVIPNSVALVKPCAPTSAARVFVEFLLRPETLQKLAAVGALDIPSLTPSPGEFQLQWSSLLDEMDQTVTEIDHLFKR